ncbi:hypothetical protein GF377_07265 [candidate division GN15 bacterium]|nr:hypothetical protein [candidate division GN15 bacterium]
MVFDKQLIDQITEAWRTNNRVNLFLIERISDEGLGCTLSKRGGRHVVRQFAHMHNNRVWHLQKRAADLAEGLYVFETTEEPDRETLRKDLEASAERLERYWQEAVTGEPKRRGFKKGVITYLSYFIAHESHHRGSILLTIKTCGHKLDQKSSCAIWDWDRI